MADGRVLAVAGAKGGVGKTTTAVNLGVALAGAGETVAIVEMDLAMANIVDFLQFEPERTLHDVLSGTVTTTDALYAVDERLHVLPAGTELADFNAINVAALAPVVRSLRPAYDWIILDTAAGVSPETIYPLRLSDEVLIVSTPRVASIRDAKKTIELADRVNGTVGGVIFVRSGTGQAPPPERLAGFLDTELLGSVPNDPTVAEAQDRSQPVSTYAPESPAAEAYQRIADTLILSAPDSGQDGERVLGTGGVSDLQNAEQIAKSAANADPDNLDGATRPLEGDELDTGEADDGDSGFEFVKRKGDST